MSRRHQFVDITGQRFGRLTALQPAGKYFHMIAWLCQCECGRQVTVAGNTLRMGAQQSCGCWNRELMARLGRASKRHGHCVAAKTTPEYRSWGAMRDRCRRPGHKAYKHYGGRGIQVCERWSLFENFLADMGPRPPGHTLDRVNNDGDYEPSNCRWATLSEQNKNQRRRHRD